MTKLSQKAGGVILCAEITLGWHDAWPAPAKINLFLHVVGRRADGYHLLQTVFRFLDHGDSLRFTPLDDGQILLSTPIPGVPVESDLCYRAARLLQQTTGLLECGVEITLEKRLPMGGGLGGGSSDAATVLLALNHLWGCGLSREALQALGLQLGADVPVFIFGQNAFAEGVGEALCSVELPEAWYIVLEPPVQVPTATIFSEADLCRNTPRIDAINWQPDQGHNDLEPVACRHFPAVAEYLAWLRQFAPARMSGSGACVFAPFPTEQAACQVLAQCPTGMRGWVAAGLKKHPLHPLES
jgi:4-diphosphocytidyl-2-C-methyl-D-erythritol kinase